MIVMVINLSKTIIYMPKLQNKIMFGIHVYDHFTQIYQDKQTLQQVGAGVEG